ncbi:MAG TPA: alpha/beta hydrolase [Pyrinomonadaceae bacterium]|nr:alpha/beta hydrolase [Pyrinomonadaceae bacterium]
MTAKKSNPQITQILFLICVICVICGPANGQTTSGSWIDYAGSDVDIFPNVTYAKANNIELKLDLYLPKNRTSPTPTLILFHGGGWVDGQKERNVLYLMPYLAMGWSAVNVEYRTGHQSPAPAAVEDTRCALRWITNHAREYSLDSAKFVLTGTSAGGHLSLITGMLPANSVFDRQCTVDGGARWNTAAVPEMKVAAIVNWFGIGDVADLLEGPNAKNYAREWFGSMSNAEQLAKQLSPVNYVRAGLPPIITIHGENDDVAPYSHAVRLHALLDKAGVPNQLVTIRGRKHGGFSREEMIDSYAKIREFLRKQGIQ